MSVEAIMEAPADPEAGARELDVEAALLQELAEAKTAEERGRVHDDLARHYARRTLYRKMNRQEKASIRAYAEGANGAPLAESLALYERAMTAFGSRKSAEGIALLRASRALAVAHLPLRHSWVLRVSHTLAGRLTFDSTPGAPSALDEIIALRELLEREAIANCGSDHHATTSDMAHLAYAYASKGRYAEALERFEKCFRFHLASPRRVHEARVLLSKIASIYRAIGDPEGVSSFEERLLAADPSARSVVEDSRFERDPALRAEFDRRSIAHAAPLFVGHAAARAFAGVVALLDTPASTDTSVSNEITRALITLERELGLYPEEDDEKDDVDYSHPLCETEWAFQRELSETLWAAREAQRLNRPPNP